MSDHTPEERLARIKRFLDNPGRPVGYGVPDNTHRAFFTELANQQATALAQQVAFAENDRAAAMLHMRPRRPARWWGIGGVAQFL